MKSGFKLPTSLTSAVTAGDTTFLSSYTLNPAWNSFFIRQNGELRSISHLFEQRASLGELKLIRVKNMAESFDAILVSQFSTTTTNYWNKVPGIDAYPCVSMIKKGGTEKVADTEVVKC